MLRLSHNLLKIEHHPGLKNWVGELRKLAIANTALHLVLLREISLRKFFLNGVLFDLRESTDKSFLNTYVNGQFVQWRWSDSLWQKRLLCSVTVGKRTFLCDTTSPLNKLTTYEPPYMVTPNCLWIVGCQIVSVLTSLTGASAKCKRKHVKRCPCSCAKHLGGLAVTTLPPHVHLIRPWSQTTSQTLATQKWVAVILLFLCVEASWISIWCYCVI